MAYKEKGLRENMEMLLFRITKPQATKIVISEPQRYIASSAIDRGENVSFSYLRVNKKKHEEGALNLTARTAFPQNRAYSNGKGFIVTQLANWGAPFNADFIYWTNHDSNLMVY